jgi:hypothetical protein
MQYPETGVTLILICFLIYFSLLLLQVLTSISGLGGQGSFGQGKQRFSDSVLGAKYRPQSQCEKGSFFSISWGEIPNKRGDKIIHKNR